MFSRRTVMLLVNMSSVIMVTRRVHRAVTRWTPSGGGGRRARRRVKWMNYRAEQQLKDRSERLDIIEAMKLC